jgi:hypothetical protein
MADTARIRFSQVAGEPVILGERVRIARHCDNSEPRALLRAHSGAHGASADQEPAGVRSAARRLCARPPPDWRPSQMLDLRGYGSGHTASLKQ